VRLRFNVGFCEVIIESMWLLFLDLKKDECLSGDEVAVLEPILNHVAIS